MENKRNGCCDLSSHQLQQDIVDLILERLGALDRISFGAVCTRWREAVARSSATSALPFPFVLHARRFPEENHSLSSLDDDRVYHLNRYHTAGGICVGIIEGRWLIMSQLYLLPPKDSSCERQIEVVTGYSILNPVTRKEFLLPKRRHSPDSDTDNSRLPSFFRVMRASNSEPTPSNCLVAGLSNSGSLLGFCRATDSEWTMINLEDEFKGCKFQDIIFCHGKLYVLTIRMKDFIIAYDCDDNENGVYKAHKIVMTVPWQISLRSTEVWHLQDNSYSFYSSYVSLATDSVSGELLLIVCDVKFLSKKSPPDHLSPKILVKVEVISMSVYRLYVTNDQGRWIKVTDLGDRMLFYGNCSNFFIPTKAFEESHQGNCIYYAIRANEDCWDVGKFCLNNQTIIPCPIKRRNVCGWLAPQFRKCDC